MVYVVGITSLVQGKPTDRNSLHIFMWESDEPILLGDLMNEFEEISERHKCDFYYLRSRPDETRYHVISFDIMSGHQWRRIFDEVPIETDYPSLFDRMYDKYWTLRLGNKGKVPMPIYITRTLAEDNIWLKSGWHSDIYRKLCGVPIPEYYYGQTMYNMAGPLLVKYNTQHVG